jgi:hypothetical protein
MAFEIPEYTAVGEGLTTCIRVYQMSALCAGGLQRQQSEPRTLSRSIGYITECSCRAISMQRWGGSGRVAYSDARESACHHVRGEGKVWRQRFIARSVVSGGHVAVDGGLRTRVLLLRQLSAHGWPLTDRVPATQIPALRLRTALAFAIYGSALARMRRDPEARAGAMGYPGNMRGIFVVVNFCFASDEMCSKPGRAVDKMIGSEPRRGAVIGKTTGQPPPKELS